MTGLMGKWPSRHGQLIKIRLPDGCGGKPFQWWCNLDMITMELKAIWEISDKLSDHFSQEHTSGILWNDPDLGIDWPVTESEAILSNRDHAYPRLKALGPILHMPSG